MTINTLRNLAQLLADREDRVERCLRVLQDHRNSAPANIAHLALRASKNILSR